MPKHFDQGSVSFRSHRSDMLTQRAQQIAIGDGSLERRRQLGVSPLSRMNRPGKSPVLMTFAGIVSCGRGA